jgi:predicted RNA-binding protein with TRAM domain
MKKKQKRSKHKGKYSLKAPVQIGNEYNVDITSITPRGLGMARVKGFIVLINGAQIGENKTVIITKVEPLNAEAELVA